MTGPLGALEDGSLEAALEGVKVLEVCTFIAGPFASLMLADLGASVTKVEIFPDGDPFRRMGGAEAGENVVYTNCNRDKEILFLDPASTEDQAEFRRQVAAADVLITNWRASSTASFGLTDEIARELNRGLVWIKLSGYGRSGPLADQPAFDPVIQARSGVASVQGVDDTPELLHFFFADKTAAAFVVSTALAALVRRERSGRGAIVDVPMLDSLVYFNFPDVFAHLTVLGDGDAARPQRRRGSQVVRTADGWLLVVAVGGRQLADTLAAIGHPEWKEQLLAAAPTDLAPLLYDMLRRELPKRTNAEWLEEFARRKVPAAPVVDPTGTLVDPQIVHNGTFSETEHPEFGRIRTVRFPARESE
ncbi:MAG: CoA transferase [Acidimicrobiia bacterium]